MKHLLQDLFKFRRFFYILISLAIVGYFGSCENKATDITKLKPYSGPTLKAFDIELFFSDSARLKIKMNAPLQLEYESGDQDFPKGVKVVFYDSLAKENTQITALKAKFIKAENRYVAIGNVIVKNLKKNEQLNTEELSWTPNNQTIFTDKFVTITTDKEILKGEGLTARQDFTGYKIKKPTGKFTVEQ